MKTEVVIQIRAFPVLAQDQRTGEEVNDTIVLTKEQLQAAQLVQQSAKELIYRSYNRVGFKVLKIGAPTKREIKVDLEQLFKGENQISSKNEDCPFCETCREDCRICKTSARINEKTLQGERGERRLIE